MPIYFHFNHIFKVAICNLEQDSYFAAKARKKDAIKNRVSLNSKETDGGSFPFPLLGLETEEKKSGIHV